MNLQTKPLQPMDAETLHLCDPLYMFMDAESLKAECNALLDALPATTQPITQSPDRETMFAIANAFCSAFSGVAPPEAAVQRACALLAPSQIALLRYRLMQVLRAIDFSTRVQREGFDRTRTFAVPTPWNRRFEMLIGGQLLPAWVMFCSVDEF